MTDLTDAAIDALVKSLSVWGHYAEQRLAAADAITALREKLATAERDAYARGMNDAVRFIDTAGDGAVTEALSTQLCCNGHHCGCQGADVGSYLQHAIRALPHTPGVVGVKPLVWMDIDGAGPITCLLAKTPFGNYYIDRAGGGDFRAYFVNGSTIYLGKDITAAKAAAQADYEARIRSALPPQAEGGAA